MISVIILLPLWKGKSYVIPLNHKQPSTVAVFDNPEAYSLPITATDDGEMSVSFDDTGESYGAAEYPDMEIKTGQVFSMELPA